MPLKTAVYPRLQHLLSQTPVAKGDTATVERFKSTSKTLSAAQQHWLRGFGTERAAAEAALTAFQKVKRPVTPRSP